MTCDAWTLSDEFTWFVTREPSVKLGATGLIALFLARVTVTAPAAPRPAATTLYSTALLRPSKYRPVTTLWSTKTRSRQGQGFTLGRLSPSGPSCPGANVRACGSGTDSAR